MSRTKSRPDRSNRGGWDGASRNRPKTPHFLFQKPHGTYVSAMVSINGLYEGNQLCLILHGFLKGITPLHSKRR